jgi:hypothetical protein
MIWQTGQQIKERMLTSPKHPAVVRYGKKDFTHV